MVAAKGAGYLSFHLFRFILKKLHENKFLLGFVRFFRKCSVRFYVLFRLAILQIEKVQRGLQMHQE